MADKYCAIITEKNRECLCYAQVKQVTDEYKRQMSWYNDRRQRHEALRRRRKANAQEREQAKIIQMGEKLNQLGVDTAWLRYDGGAKIIMGCCDDPSKCCRQRNGNFIAKSNRPWKYSDDEWIEGCEIKCGWSEDYKTQQLNHFEALWNDTPDGIPFSESPPVFVNNSNCCVNIMDVSTNVGNIDRNVQMCNQQITNNINSKIADEDNGLGDTKQHDSGGNPQLLEAVQSLTSGTGQTDLNCAGHWTCNKDCEFEFNKLLDPQGNGKTCEQVKSETKPTQECSKGQNDCPKEKDSKQDFTIYLIISGVILLLFIIGIAFSKKKPSNIKLSNS